MHSRLMALGGFTWFQGEANLFPVFTNYLRAYACQQPAMIVEWHCKFSLVASGWFGLVQLEPWISGDVYLSSVPSSWLHLLSRVSASQLASTLGILPRPSLQSTPGTNTWLVRDWLLVHSLSVTTCRYRPQPPVLFFPGQLARPAITSSMSRCNLGSGLTTLVIRTASCPVSRGRGAVDLWRNVPAS